MTAESESEPKLTTTDAVAKGARLEGGEYCLITEVVVPGFDVEDTEMIGLGELQKMCPDWKQCADLIYHDVAGGSDDGASAARTLYAQDKFYRDEAQ